MAFTYGKTYYSGMNDVRKKIISLVEEKGFDLKSVSLAMGRNHAYLHQFLNRGIPRKLAEEDRERLAIILDISPEDLKEGNQKLPKHDLKEEVSKSFEYGGLGNKSKELIPQTTFKKLVLDERKLHKIAIPIAKEILEKHKGDASVDNITDLAWRMVDMAKQHGEKGLNAEMAEWLLTWKE